MGITTKFVFDSLDTGKKFLVTWEWNTLEGQISSIRAQIVADRIEKRCQVDELDFAGLRFAAVGCRSIDLDSIYFRSWQPICEKIENRFLYF